MSLKSFRLLAVCASLLVAACSSAPSPLTSEPVRKGADQSAPVTATLPPAPSPGRYDPGIAANNEERGAVVGTTVAPEGGQKAQEDKEAKNEAAIEAQQNKEREAQERQESSDQKTSQ